MHQNFHYCQRCHDHLNLTTGSATIDQRMYHYCSYQHQHYHHHHHHYSISPEPFYPEGRALTLL
ncbi:hypothetical protein E2C01_094389 [Portunus trituberculatus]|uniref:Uncharacterized protein n=1 Tax=Portunus trituberculatus TaxID=210409 RepID=A0A5B7K0K9_PORTR|nr:hypothetical protein [Portunus trituberculatus]